MRYGKFDDKNREYVITRPDTPLPWINYLGCEAYFGIISNTAGGYSFYKDARLRRITRYRYNNAPFDMGGRYIYLRDAASGEFWSPSWMPTRHEAAGLFLPARDGIHDHRFDVRRDRSPHPLLRADGREPGDLAAHRHQPPQEAGQAFGVFLDRVLPVGRAGRPDQLPAQLLDRAGRSRGRGDLPQDGIPRTAGSLRLLRLLGKARRVRHPARRLPRRLPRLGQARRSWKAAARPIPSRTAGPRSDRTTSRSA